MPTSFPDDKYLHDFAQYEGQKADQRQDDIGRVLASSGVLLNWVGDVLSDPGWKWERRNVLIDNITMTGTHPEWNEIIIKQAERSPKKFREIIAANPELRSKFKGVEVSDRPIMLRVEDKKLKVFDGMHRVIAAIIAGRTEIEAFIGTPPDKPRPSCEPHVVYDLLRAYAQKRTRDRAGLITALRYLRGAYANVDELLRTRFSKEWVDDKELQEIISAALQD